MHLPFFQERFKREGEERKREGLVEEVKGLKEGQWADWKWMELI